MKTLFIISKPPETRAIFDLAKSMAIHGDQVIFLFAGEGRRCAQDRELMNYLSFSVRYVLREGSEKVESSGAAEINYDGWVELLESCDRIVSWI